MAWRSAAETLSTGVASVTRSSTTAVVPNKPWGARSGHSQFGSGSHVKRTWSTPDAQEDGHGPSTPPEFFAADHTANGIDYAADAMPAPMMGLAAGEVDRWVEEQMFEEDVRSVLKMMRPNRREKLSGWNEYRTGGSHYRITVSWDDEFQITAGDAQQSAVPTWRTVDRDAPGRVGQDGDDVSRRRRV